MAKLDKNYPRVDLLRSFIDEHTGKSYITIHICGSRLDPKNYKSIPCIGAKVTYDEWLEHDLIHDYILDN